MRQAFIHKAGRVRGFSLIEAMISIALGLFILGGVLSLYLNNRQTFRLQSALARVQENARFANQVVEREIRKAGYRSSITQDYMALFPEYDAAFGAQPAFPAGRVLRGTRDEILLRYQGSGLPADGTITDCAGRPVASNEVATVALKLVGTDLTCFRIGSSGTTSQPLVSGVESLVFEYGWDMVANDGFADKYQEHGNSAQPTVSVRVSFTVVSAERGVVQGGDGRLRRSYTQLTALRNAPVRKAPIKNSRNIR